MSYICKSLFLKTYLQYQHLYHLVFSHRNAIVFWTQVEQETSEIIYTRVCEHVYTYAHIKRHLLQGISLYTCGAWIGKNEIHRTGPLKDRLKLAGQKAAVTAVISFRRRTLHLYSQVFPIIAPAPPRWLKSNLFT